MTVYELKPRRKKTTGMIAVQLNKDAETVRDLIKRFREFNWEVSLYEDENRNREICLGYKHIIKLRQGEWAIFNYRTMSLKIMTDSKIKSRYKLTQINNC